ncbi:LptF/LptG family permease [Porticoccaceae bacterium]|nr:LptF/LptG family permease [Porticoccaceae bacterium]
MMRRLSWHVGTTVFASIAVTLMVLVGLDSVGAIIDQSGDITRNYFFTDALIYVVTLVPSRIYEYIPFASLIGCLVGLGLLAGNSEVIVMRAAGVSPLRIVGFVLKPVLIFVILGMTIGEYFSPYLDQLAEGKREYLRKGESAQDSSSGLWNREGNQFMHANAVFPGGVLYGVTRYQFNDDREIEEAEGLKPVIAPEVEFYLIGKNIDPDSELKPPIGRSGRYETARQSYSIDAANEFEDFVETMYSYGGAMGLDLDTLIHESGAAQLEVNFIHGDPLDLADQVFTFKRLTREAALKHNIYATFMAKPMASEPGSAKHIHQSVLSLKDGSNIFATADGEYSEAFYHYLGGLQTYTPFVMSFFAPNVNSYRRFTREVAAPINLHWGFDNRTTGLRVPDAAPKDYRIENRFPGADVNPYLSIAASLACGYLGLKKGIKASEPFTGNAYNEEMQMPRTLEEALRGLKEDNDIVEIFGSEFIQLYTSIKLAEFEEFNRVISSWEREFLLLAV